MYFKGHLKLILRDLGYTNKLLIHFLLIAFKKIESWEAKATSLMIMEEGYSHR